MSPASSSPTLIARLQRGSGLRLWFALGVGLSVEISLVVTLALLDLPAERFDDALHFSSLLALLAATVAWNVARRLLEPLDALTQALRAMATDAPLEPLALEGGMELNALTDAFNALVERIQRDAAGLRDRLGEAEEQIAQHRRERLGQDHAAMLHQFRDVFRPDRPKTVFDVATAVRDAIGLVQDAYQTEGISLATLRFDRRPLQAYGHPSEFGQVLLHLLTNAKEAVQARVDTAGSVRVSATADGGRIRVAVEDNGGGIPPDVLSRVFDPCLATKPDGSGVGLYLAKILMRRMAGDVRLINSGHGVLAEVTLPAAASA